MECSIFISYRRDDTSTAVSSLLQRLQQKFGTGAIFADNASIKDGEIWPDKIKTALEQSKIVLVVIGNNWLCTEKEDPSKIRLCNEADWVRKEIETAQALNKKIIPVLSDTLEIPFHASLPDSIKKLMTNQYRRIKFQPGDEEPVNNFMELLFEELEDIESPDFVKKGLRRGGLVEKYKLIKTIAVSKKSNVYLGRDTGLDREVIIKAVADPGFNADFQSKLKIVAKINDCVPNCISILGAYVNKEPYHVITTYLKKGSLRKMLKLEGKALPFQQAKKILLDIAHSLKQTHDINLTHCNVKPSNIILDDNNDAYLNHMSRVPGGELKDILNRLSDRDAYRDQSVYNEELCYLAPEIFDSETGNESLDESYRKTDQYMLGLVGYEMLTGRLPATISSIEELRQNGTRAFKALPEISQVRTRCPQKLSGIIHRMIHKNPARRYRDIQEVINEINQVSFDVFEIAKDSFNRCMGADGGALFFKTFYERLLSKLPVPYARQLSQKGVGTSSSHRQYDMLRQGIFILLQFGQHKLYEREPNILSTVAVLHDQHHHNIPPNLYAAFTGALIDTVAGAPPAIPTAFDKQCETDMDIITDAWEKALAPGIRYMTEKYFSKD